MKIGLFSDSHNNIANLKEAFDHLKDNEGMELAIHLGDDYADARAIEAFAVPFFTPKAVPVIKVPGVYDPEYRDTRIANRMIKDFEGWKFLITHTPHKHANDRPDDVDPDLATQSLGIRIVLHGHTHVPKIEESNNIFFINPGHLRDIDTKNYPPSFALLDVSKEEVQVRIIGLRDKKDIEKLSILGLME